MAMPISAHRGRTLPAGGRGKRLVGNVIKFPDEGRIVRFGRDAADESGDDHHPAGDPDRAVCRSAGRGGRAPHASAGGQRRPPTGETPLNGRRIRCRRSARCRREIRRAVGLAPSCLLLVVLSGCSSIGDFGRLSDAAGHRRHSCLGRRGGSGPRRRAGLRRQSHR